jgi:tRNA nucleotidyltransferase (CCA-adding enzyme)
VSGGFGSIPGTYLVGGAVRDALLGLPVRERDWVVVGASPERMREKGFRPVGKDFPVFLHPVSGEEYALARTERKSGRGYHGFVFNASPEVTLEDDLQRRDLTVNAIAQAEDGTLIDPCNGRADIEARLLRHVGPAFAEDPVRILRTARFAARFHPLGFRVADETLALMRGMVEAGEVDHLVPERVWRETARALDEPRPSVFFNLLREVGALSRLMPELDALYGVPQRADYHPEVDTGIHIMLALDQAAHSGQPQAVRVAVLLHDLGKARTPEKDLPSHPGHEARGLPLIRQFCERLRVPNAQRDLALAVCAQHINVHRARELRPQTLLRLLDELRAFKDETFFEQALAACECDTRGRQGKADCEYDSPAYLRAARDIAAGISARDVMRDGVDGAAIGLALREARARALRQWRKDSEGDG